MMPIIFKQAPTKYFYSIKKIQAMKLFELSFDKLLIRFYLIMLIVIVAGFTGLWWLAFLALPVFFSALMGMTINKKVTIQHRPQAAESSNTCQVGQRPAKV
jgi:type IV secretory pathway TrbL component